MFNKKTNKNIEWKTIESIQELIALKDEWQLLYVKQHHKNPFCCPLWILNWYHIYWQNNWELKVLAGFVDGKIIVFVPTYLQREKYWPFLTTMYPLAQGEHEEIELATEYIDILIESQWKSVALPYIHKWFNLQPVDIICWNAILSGSNVHTMAISIGNTKLIETSRYIIKNKDWNEKNLSKNTKKRINKNRNKLAKVHTELKWLNKKELEDYWPMMVKFHQKRWQVEGKKGAFKGREFSEFHKNIINSKQKIIPLFSVLLINNKVAAIHYYLAVGDTLHFYQSGWDSTSMARYSPGLSLHLWSIKNNPYQYYDFMMGNKLDSYKSQFGCDLELMLNINVSIRPYKIILHQIITKIINKNI